MTDVDRKTASGSDSPTTPAESDEALEPVDIFETDHGTLLFYLAGRVPIPIQGLAEDTKQSAAVLRDYFYEELQNEVDIDSTGFVRLTHSARKPVIRFSKPYIRAGQEQFDAGQSSTDQTFLHDAIDHFLKAVRIFEQIRTRLEAVNYSSEKLQQRIDTARSSIEEAQEVMGDSANRVEALLEAERSDADSNAPSEVSNSSSATNTREAMLETVSGLHERLGRIPKTTELPEGCEYSPNDFYNEFGSWDGALEAAGIDKKQALLDDIERIAEKLGRVPKSTDMDEHGTYSGSNYSSYFDSWSTAVKRAELEEDREENLLETLQSLNKSLDRLPKTTDLHDVSGVSQHDYIRNFGSWDKALDAAGIDKEQHLIDGLRQVAAEVAGKPGTKAADRIGEYSSGMYHKYFGSWDAALEAADLSDIDTATKQREGTEEKSSGTATLGPSTPIENITSHVDRVGPRSVSRLKNSGYTTLGNLCNAEPKIIAKHKGIGRTKAIKLVRFATENASESQAASTEQSEKLEPISTLSEDTDATSETPEDNAPLDPTTPVDDIGHRVDGVGHSSIHAVKKAGYNTLGDLHDANPGDITEHRGIGRTKALKLIRFATENVSSNGASSGQSSKHQQNADRPSSSTPKKSSSRLQPSALDMSWETIPANERINGQFMLQVKNVDRRVGDRKTARLDVRDKNGREFALDIWMKHDIDREWKAGEWYAVESARGKVWESSDGTTRKQLSSTKDLNIVELGADFDPASASVEDASISASEPQQSEPTTDGDISSSTPDSTASGRNTAAASGDGDSSEDDGHEVDNDGLLGDIMSDFDEI